MPSFLSLATCLCVWAAATAGASSGSVADSELGLGGGQPTVSVGLMTGASEVRLWSSGRLRAQLGEGLGALTAEVPEGQRLWVRRRSGAPGKTQAWVQLSERLTSDKRGLTEDRRRLATLGQPLRTKAIGSVWGVAGRVIDNRRSLLVVDRPGTVEEADALRRSLQDAHGVEATLFLETLERSSGALALLDERGRVLGEGPGPVHFTSIGADSVSVGDVEHDRGYRTHGFEDRRFRGAIQVTFDSDGMLAVVNRVELEQLLRGLVPAEIHPRSPVEALKAQAVTARGEVLAKLGLKHLHEPFSLCAEQHCAVYRGVAAETEGTDAAVAMTRGEALFSREGQLVDSVYSAVCGGHTEDNEAVWGGVPSRHLRGRPDLLTRGRTRPLRMPATVEARLAVDLPAACRLATVSVPSKYRWERRFDAEELDQLLAPLGVGRIQALTVTARGVSGRAKALTVSGETGVKEVRGELVIRRTLGMLNSALFVVELERHPDGRPARWTVRGGGWGHGVGMCQTGAIGRAEAGQSYRQILRFYFGGADLARLY